MTLNNSTMVSVVVTTKNEEKHIGSCLKSLARQTYPQSRIEIIVVDNKSIDRTKEIALRYTNQVFDHGPERAAQRNYGIGLAQGDYVLYLDADMILHPQVIEDCVEEVVRRPEVVGLYISEIVMGESYFCKVRRFERRFYDATVIDCVRFIKRATFLESGGFDETMSGPEDWDLDKKIRRLGCCGLITRPIYHDESDFNLYRYINKKRYYTLSFESYIKKWGKNDPDVRRQLGLRYRYVGVFMEHGKWRRLIRSPILATGMYCLRFIIGLVYLLPRHVKESG